MPVIVDTPVWSIMLRRPRKRLSPRERPISAELRDLITEGDVVLLGPIRQEVLTGIRSDSDFETLRAHLAHFLDEPLGSHDYEEAARCHNRCRMQGVQGSPVDFLLCAAAIHRGIPVFTTNLDFRRYAKHLPVTLYEMESG